MTPRTALALTFLGLTACSSPPPVKSAAVWPTKTALQDADPVLPPGVYVQPPKGPDGMRGVLRFEGLQGQTIDLTGVDLRGNPAGSDPDTCSGHGVVLVNCKNVTIKGGRLGGYKACIVLEGCTSIVLEDLRFDDWYAQRLRSTVASEDGADWLYPHENDAGQWLANHGAAISATRCSDLTIRRCAGSGGQNGILLTQVTGSKLYDNDFSFLSGWGLAMYRSSENTVSHNWFDYCVRGYSHGVYARGQDSAGILMFERCSDNVVAFNSATHGGDGVFVFAGQDLVAGRARERGEPDPGGCDRNLFYGNDLRFSPANALEVTFSDGNLIVKNDLSGCSQHGVWGGYSRNTLILGNTIDDTVGGGITIEHGQDNVIVENTFSRNNMAVELYWDPDPHLVNSPLGEQRDTSSRDSWIIGNTFEGNTQDLVIKQTTGLVLFNNEWKHDGTRAPYIDQLSAEGEEATEETLRTWMADRAGKLPTGHFSASTLRAWQGRYPGLLDEFGRMRAPDVPGTLTVRAEDRGVEIGDRSTIVMGEWGPWNYRAGHPRPEQRLPGGELASVEWDARWFRWTEENDPRRDLELWRAAAEEPLVAKRVPNFLNPWSDEDVRAVTGNDRFGLVATGAVEVDGGSYDLVITSDDGVRLSVDGKEVFADWTWHAPKRDELRLELTKGRHELALEYFQIDGATALVIELIPVE
ncbi:MAG: right-handed parallel beta-helix repeat-containing protein [Planctomycetota bacterium]|nr:right-handed parallel beta-helix repeat-containing protein [Planctomycetota bacterium]